MNFGHSSKIHRKIGIVRSASRSRYVRRSTAERRPLTTMLLAALTLLIFTVTLGLAMSLLYVLVETPLARRKMMTRLAAVQEVAARNEEIPDVLRKELLSDVPALHRILATVPGIARLRLFLEQGAIQMQVGNFVLISIAISPYVRFVVVVVGLTLYAALPAATEAGVILTEIVSAIR